MDRRLFIQSCLAAGALASIPSFAWAKHALRTQTQLRMGTLVSISVAHSSNMLADDAIGKAFERMVTLEAIFSRRDSASALGTLNSQGSLKDAPKELCSLLAESIKLYKLTNGSFDVSVAPLVDLLESGNVNSKAWGEAKELADISSLNLSASSVGFKKSGMAVTLDGIAKGAIVDEAVKSLRASGLENFILNAGGDIYAAGFKEAGKSWKIAIESPEKDGKYPAVIELSDRAVATSGGYERPGHLVDPRSGKIANNYKSVSVSAPTVKEADALATALSTMPLMQAKAFAASRPGCSALFIDNNGRLHSSNWA